MKTGLKTFIKKIIENLKDPKFIYEKINWEKFPEKATSCFFVNLKLNSIEKDLKEEEKNNRSTLSGLLGKPHPLVLKIYNRFLKYNPNNLGNWSDGKNLTGTKKIENELIKILTDLYQADKRKIEGYITSGGTEGNIFSCWVGREYFKKKFNISINKICLLKTSLTHYSLKKAAEICEIKEFLVSLDENFKMDINHLSEIISDLYKKGYRGFLICLTLGYTVTGTADDFKKIDRVIDNIKIKWTKAKFFLWIDGASDGWVRVFLEKKFSPFRYKNIQTFLSDFHKFGLMPYPAGFVLYRKELRKFVEKEIPYLEEKDSTLLGSRQGITALAIWYLIWCLGKKGFTDLYKKLIKKKELLIRNKLIEYKKKNKEIKFFTDKFSLTIGFFSQKKINENFKINLKLLINKKFVRFYIQKYYFLPSV